MMNDYQDNFPSSELDNGRSFGKGRGFLLRKPNINSSPVGVSGRNMNYDWQDNQSKENSSENNLTNVNNNVDWGTGANAAVESTDNSSNNYQNDSEWTNNSNEQDTNNDWTSSNYDNAQNFDNADENDNKNYQRGHDSNNRRGKRDGDDNHGSRSYGGRNDRNGNRDENRGRPRNSNREGIDDENTEENDEERKPPVTYIPPERSTDDAEVFGSGVAAGINFDKYDNIKVDVSGDNVPSPIENFSSTNLRLSLIENIKKSGYTKPTPVQKYAIPIMLNNRDVMACAQTGSGKTAAYLIPMIHKLLEANDELRLIDRGCEPQVVIMAPTRELVTQICWEAQKFSKDTTIKSIAVYGGVATMHQVRQLERGAHIVVATPGRLCDFVERGRITFSAVRFMVLDEADRMLDQGFLSSMETILQHESMVPTAERQTAMFSATFPSDVQSLAARFMNNYLFLSVGIVGGACEDVEQVIYEVEKKDKRRKLHELLQMDRDTKPAKKTLVFVETKQRTDVIAAYLSVNKIPSTSIHGDRLQKEREIALSDFKSGRMPILVATSVAARGLDIPEVSHVINYDLPKSIDEYIHRIGRTGRMGNEGKATSFYDPSFDNALAPDLVRILTQANKNIPDFLSNSGGFDGGITNDFGGYDIRNEHTNQQTEPEEQW